MGIGSRGGGAAALYLARVELLAGNLLDPVHVPQDGTKFVTECAPPLGQVGRGFQQVLVRGDLTSGGEQQRRHCVIAVHPVLRDVLTANAQRHLRQLLVTDLGGRVAQHIGDDLVRLEERPQHGARDERALRA